ncbi:MAG: MATE family efflux transporter, partial [Actinomyces sp.]|nr:MATE family efflux transporter [Actinomyces sp.]
MRGSSLTAQILGLAVPALGALVAEPLFVLIDSAMVGHLGTPQLAGLALASTVLQTVVGVFVFLAYSTTALAARALGAGHADQAVRSGIEAMWLAAGLGIVAAVALIVSGPALVSALGADPEVAPHAIAYLRASAPGLVGMFIVLAATGTLRGLLDTRTPLVVATGGAAFNVVANAVLIYAAGLGVAGSGAGTAVAQTLMAVALVWVVVRGARRLGVPLRPSAGGVWGAALDGAPLLVRTLALRVAL